MSLSLKILADHEALSLEEKNKRRDQSIHRPRWRDQQVRVPLFVAGSGAGSALAAACLA